CDVADDLTLDRPLGELATAGSELLEIVGHLDHTPPQPPGVPDSFYKPALDALMHGNLHMNGPKTGDALLLSGVEFWLWDSDKDNMGRVGHRRWALNPRMARVAFGAHGKFTVMYAHDSSRNARARDFVAFPGRGFFPLSLMQMKEAAWSCAFDLGEFSVPTTA